MKQKFTVIHDKEEIFTNKFLSLLMKDVDAGAVSVVSELASRQ